MHLVFFNGSATTEIYTLSLHDALPIFDGEAEDEVALRCAAVGGRHRVEEEGARGRVDHRRPGDPERSEEHTSELQSRRDLVCRLLLEKKKKNIKKKPYSNYISKS